MLKHFDSLLELTEAFPDEQAAIDHFTAIRWKDGAFCPYCGSLTVYHFSDKRTHKCGDCHQRFSIKVGTIFEDTKLPLRKWFMAIWLITSHKKGVSSAQLARDIKITQKSAWFMLHRLRHAARTRSFNRPLKGEVEVDETFIGGKDKNKHANQRGGQRGPKGKTAVFGLLERGGEIRARKMESLAASEVQGEIARHVEPGANVMTDEYIGYRGLDERFNHHTVNHSAGEYVKNYFCHVNGIEGAWGLFKRQIYGIHHFVSTKHLDRYLDEMTWRYNRRESGEGERVNELLSLVAGRLTYRTLIA